LYHSLNAQQLSGRRLNELVDNILDFAKLKNHKLELQLQSVGLRSIVEVILTVCEPLTAGKDLQLINVIAPELPLVLADENRLQQILYNLIGNAIKFTESGIVEISAKIVDTDGETPLGVSLSNLPPSSPDFQIAVTVSDTGIGIPAANLDRIFEAFEQGDGSTVRQYGGTGLGLTLSKQFVELHGGKIYAASQVGIGSHFTFTLPISPETIHPSEPAINPQPVTKTNGLESKNNRIKNYLTSNLKLPQAVPNAAYQADVPLQVEQFKLLIVDDDPINLQVLNNHLSLQNYSVIQALNGEQALSILESGQQHFDLIILDIMMPRMSGYEVCAKLREKYPSHELPVVMLTAKN